MMVKPPLKKLENQVDSKYTLVTLAAKRARELTDGEPNLHMQLTSLFPWHSMKLPKVK